MLKGGEDPRFLARRITRMAVEDIGLADPAAQRLCLDAWATYERLGSPEGELALAEAVIYLALAPKSNAAYRAFGAAMAAAERTGSLVPPKHILNAPTRLMKSEGYGKGYVYDHDTEGGFSGSGLLPPRNAARSPTIDPAPADSRRSCEKDFCLSPPSAIGRPGPTENPSGRPTIPAKASDLIQLIYVSAAAHGLGQGDLDAIARVSLARNKVAGITGFLLHQGDAFYGALEGSERRVLRRMEAIIRDPRHSRIRVLREASIADRRFDNWSFGILPEGRDGGERGEGFISSLARGLR